MALHERPKNLHLNRQSQSSRILKLGHLPSSDAKIEVPPVNTKTHPGTDFYRHVNGRWLSATIVPKTLTSFGVSEEVEAVLNKGLRTTLQEAQIRAEGGRPTESREDELLDALGRLAMSALRPEKQKFSVDYLKRGVRSLGCMRDMNDVASTLGTMSRYSIPTLLDITILPEFHKGVPTYRIAISPGSIGLPDARYYSAAAAVPGKHDILFQYTRLCREVAKRLDLDDFSQAIPMEAELAGDLLKAQEEEFTESMRLNTLKQKYKAIPWESFFAGYGVDAAQLPEIRVDSDSWLTCINDAFKKVPLEQWYSLFVLHTVLHALPYLPPPFDAIHFSVFEKQLRGQEVKLPQAELTLNIAKVQLSAPLGYFYVNRNSGTTAKRAQLQFVRHIVDSAAERMKTLDWLGPSAAAAAERKLRAMALSVGYAERLQGAPTKPPLLQTDNLLANIYLLEAARTDELLGRCLRKGGKTDLEGIWDEPAFTVNAYYYHETNQIVIPAGCFAWPFYSSDSKKVGWNYGGLGAIIGHEITHAFDEEGKEFNDRGVAETWWSAADMKRYKEKTKELVRLFDKAKVMDRPVNGTATLSENLADLGGLGIALDALKADLKRRRVSESERIDQLREFFISYATSWRTKERPERTLQRLFMDKHAPVELRVNLIVAHFDEWYEAFDVKTADAMYIPPEERIRIF